jgi:hypothetical protein
VVGSGHTGPPSPLEPELPLLEPELLLLEPELPPEPELLLAPELPLDPEPPSVEPDEPLDPALPELLLDSMLPGEPDDELLLVPASVGVERPLSGDELHAAEAEMTAEKTTVDRICMEPL